MTSLEAKGSGVQPPHAVILFIKNQEMDVLRNKY